MKGLYIIVNRLTKFPMSAIIPAQNDVEAIRGFMAAFDTQDKEKPRFFAPITEHKLVCIGHVNDYCEIVDSNYTTICNGEDCDNVLENLIKELMEE